MPECDSFYLFADNFQPWTFHERRVLIIILAIFSVVSQSTRPDRHTNGLNITPLRRRRQRFARQAGLNVTQSLSSHRALALAKRTAFLFEILLISLCSSTADVEFIFKRCKCVYRNSSYKYIRGKMLALAWRDSDLCVEFSSIFHNLDAVGLNVSIIYKKLNSFI